MTGEDIQELDNSGFYTEGPTIAVGNLFNETRIVQVYANGVSLLNAGNNSLLYQKNFWNI
jgi:cleavage and polyadenylation specificity factor subunit 1